MKRTLLIMFVGWVVIHPYGRVWHRAYHMPRQCIVDVPRNVV
jgi:hypothetical protein